MATLVLGAIGGAIGGQVGAVVGIYLASVLFPQRLPTVERGKLEDLRITTSSYGVMIPIVYGTVKIGGNIIWATDLHEHVRTERVGGKGGGGKQTIHHYTYTCSFAVAVCEGPITGISRIWAEDMLIYEEGASEATVRVYPGDEDQVADPLIAGIEGAENTPAHRGLAYVVFEELPLGDWGNRIPNLSFEVSRLEVGNA